MFHCTGTSRHHGRTCSDSLSGSSNELFYSAGHTNFIYQLSVELGFTSNNASKRTIKLSFMALSKQSGQHIEKETAVDERKVFQHFSFSKPIKSSVTSLDLHQHTSTRL